MISRVKPSGTVSTRTGPPPVDGRAIGGMAAPARWAAAPSSSGTGRPPGSWAGSNAIVVSPPCRRPPRPRHDNSSMTGAAQTVEVSEGVYAYIQPDGSWYINNTGFIAGGGGVISIDTCSTERRTRAYLEAVAAVTGQPVRTLVNTHHHGDHTYGNCLLPQATIVGHRRCREEVLASGPPA